MLSQWLSSVDGSIGHSLVSSQVCISWSPPISPIHNLFQPRFLSRWLWDSSLCCNVGWNWQLLMPPGETFSLLALYDSKLKFLTDDFSFFF
jgi:hypothetical protein